MFRIPALLWLSFVLPLATADTPECDAVQVDTTSGLLEGCKRYVPERNQYVKQFRGVPYAEQPVGDLRFRRPLMKSREKDTVITKSYGNVCPQGPGWMESVSVNFTAGEDCLWLNIYAPASASTNRSVDVMLFVHGGSYIDGTGNYYEGHHLALVGDVVVVTINYRLGVLGFLSAEDPSLMGNYGLWDQLMALQWVQLNIRRFGGDPKRVTLFGNSAGSSSVGILAMSPKSKGLFHRIITQSGSPVNPWAFVRRPRIYYEKLAGAIRCTGNEKEIDLSTADCLRLFSAEAVLKLQHLAHLKWPHPEGSLLWGPWVDGELITHDPEDLLSNKTLHKTPDMQRFGELDQLIGVTSQEAAFVYEGKMNIGYKNSETDFTHDEYSALLREISSALVPSKYASVLDSMMRFTYSNVDDPTTSKERAVQYIQIYSDYAIYTGMLRLAKFHDTVSQGRGRTFMYRFDYRASWKSREVWRIGATHEDELPFVFGYPDIFTKGTKEERVYSELMMILWSNFAKNGDPNIGEDPALPEQWPPYKVGSEKFIKFSFTKAANTSVDEKLYLRRHKLWSNLIPQLRELFPPVQLPVCLSGSRKLADNIPLLSGALVIAASVGLSRW